MTTRQAAPRPGRPDMPSYGISQSEEGLLDWSWAADKLANTRNYFIATTRPDGRPHVTPVWGVLLGYTVCFSTGVDSQKARNLRANPSIVVTNESGDEAVIVEGTVEQMPKAMFGDFQRAYKTKYDWDVDGSEGPVFVVRPRKVFGFIEHSEQFTSTATRWMFDEP